MKLLKCEIVGNVSPKCSLVLGLSGAFMRTEPIRGNRDYSNANSKGTRGVYDYFALENGKMYEVTTALTWNKQERYYLLISGSGEMTRMDYEEAVVCLSGGSIEVC